MTDYFYKHQIRIFDYPKWAEPLREALRENMERIAAGNAIEIEFVRSRKSFRKEDRVKEVLAPGVKFPSNRFNILGVTSEVTQMGGSIAGRRCFNYNAAYGSPPL
jgi:hypothetical protein